MFVGVAVYPPPRTLRQLPTTPACSVHHQRAAIWRFGCAWVYVGLVPKGGLRPTAMIIRLHLRGENVIGDVHRRMLNWRVYQSVEHTLLFAKPFNSRVFMAIKPWALPSDAETPGVVRDIKTGIERHLGPVAPPPKVTLHPLPAVIGPGSEHH